MGSVLEMLMVGATRHLAERDRETDNGVRALAARYLACKATTTMAMALFSLHSTQGTHSLTGLNSQVAPVKG